MVRAAVAADASGIDPSKLEQAIRQGKLDQLPPSIRGEVAEFIQHLPPEQLAAYQSMTSGRKQRLGGSGLLGSLSGKDMMEAQRTASNRILGFTLGLVAKRNPELASTALNNVFEPVYQAEGRHRYRRSIGGTG